MTIIHPDRCDRDPRGCGPDSRFEPHHRAEPVTLHFPEHAYDGTALTVHLHYSVLEAADLNCEPDCIGADLSLTGEIDAAGYATLNTERLRQFADWLRMHADSIDAWHARHLAKRRQAYQAEDGEHG